MSIVVTGAMAAVKLSGQIILFAGGVTVNQEQRLKEIPQLDNLEVAEYAENGHRCTLTVNSFKLAPNAQIGGQGASNSASDFNLDFHNQNILSANNLKSLPDTDIKQILLQPEIIFEIVGPYGDNGEDICIYNAVGVKFAGGSGQINARGIWEGRWEFKARRGSGI